MSDTTQKEWNRIMSERIVGNGKPATPEPPEWKGTMPWAGKWDVERKKSWIAYHQHYYGLAHDGRRLPDDQAEAEWARLHHSSKNPDALSDFIARRKAKREGAAPQSAEDHPWARAGHTHADWSTDACPKCLLTGQEVRELGYYPKCDDYKREREERAKIARAMSTPLHPDIRTRLMPWRNK